MKKFDGKRSFKIVKNGVIWDKKIYKEGTKKYDKLLTNIAKDMVEQIDELIDVGSNSQYTHPKSITKKAMDYDVSKFQEKYHYSLVYVKILRLLTLKTLQICDGSLTVKDVYDVIIRNKEPSLKVFYLMVIYPLMIDNGKALVYFDNIYYKKMLLSYIDGSLERYLKKLKKDKTFPSDKFKTLQEASMRGAFYEKNSI